MNDGQDNWSKLYIPGRETPRSLMRFIPHDENEKATEEDREVRLIRVIVRVKLR